MLGNKCGVLPISAPGSNAASCSLRLNNISSDSAVSCVMIESEDEDSERGVPRDGEGDKTREFCSFGEPEGGVGGVEGSDKRRGRGDALLFVAEAGRRGDEGEEADGEILGDTEGECVDILLQFSGLVRVRFN